MPDRRTGDAELLARIDADVGEERALRSKGEAMTPTDRARLRTVEEHLDQVCDLLRQRRALREAGLDPDSARERPTDEVEGYVQ